MAKTPQDQLKLVMIQANPTVGAIEQNLNQILAFRRQHPDADLIVLPECFLTGYPLQDLVSVPHFIARTGQAIGKLAEQVRAEPGPAVLFGAPTAGADKPYNSAILIRADGTMAMTHKQELPNEDVFDEMRTFAHGSGKARPLQLNDRWKLGVMICEDGWHKKVATDLEGEGADVLIAINGSPVKLGKHAVRQNLMARRTAETGLPLLYVNLVGGQDELVFDGSSFALNANGSLATRLHYMQEDAASLTLSRDPAGHVAIARTDDIITTAPIPDEPELMYLALMQGLRDYMDKNRISHLHIGESGGIDSALATAIACDAVGADRVIATRLPSALTGDESMDLAAALCNKLGCRMETVPIGGLVDAFLGVMNHINGGTNKRTALAYENLQARIRAVILMYMANKIGGMVGGTSNRTESALGYTTLYGDSIGQYMIIKDAFKKDVRAISDWRNKHIPQGSRCPVAAPIPQRIIDRPPTAELADDQTDEASFGAFRVVDPLLEAIVENLLDTATAARAVQEAVGEPVTPAYAAEIEDRHYGSEFKRAQSGPGVQLRTRSFGPARRFPKTNHYRTGAFAL